MAHCAEPIAPMLLEDKNPLERLKRDAQCKSSPRLLKLEYMVLETVS